MPSLQPTVLSFNTLTPKAHRGGFWSSLLRKKLPFQKKCNCHETSLTRKDQFSGHCPPKDSACLFWEQYLTDFMYIRQTDAHTPHTLLLSPLPNLALTTLQKPKPPSELLFLSVTQDPIKASTIWPFSHLTYSVSDSSAVIFSMHNNEFACPFLPLRFLLSVHFSETSEGEGESSLCPNISHCSS